MPKPGPNGIYMIGDNEGRIPLGQGLGIPRTNVVRLNDVKESADGALELSDGEARKLAAMGFNGTIVLSCHSNLRQLVTFGGHHPTASADGKRFALFLNKYFAVKGPGDKAIDTVIVLACQIGRGKFLSQCKEALAQAVKPTLYGVNFICNRVGGPSIDFKYYYYGADEGATNSPANTVRGKAAGSAKSLAVAFGGKLSKESLERAVGTICDAPADGRDAGVTRPLMAKV